MADEDFKPSSPRRDPVVPTERELELELAVRERDGYITSLVDDIHALRRQLSHNAVEPSQDDSLLLPPSLINIVAPLLNKQAAPAETGKGSGATVTAALTARLGALQQENDELFEMLKKSTSGRLHEEVRDLRTVTRKLEGALKDAHGIISGLKTELEQAYQTIELRGGADPPDVKYPNREKLRRYSRSRSRTPPTNHYRQRPQDVPFGRASGRPPPSSKPIPTGPRAHKRPRVADDRERDREVPRYRAPSIQQSVASSSRGWDSRNGGQAATRDEDTKLPPKPVNNNHDEERHYSDDEKYDDEGAYHRADEQERGRMSRAPSSQRDFSYSPDPEPPAPRSRTRSPSRRSLSGSVQRAVDRSVASYERSEQGSRIRSPSYARSPVSRRSRSPRHPKSRSRSRSPRRSPSPRRSRSPSRLRRPQEMRSPVPPLRRDRARERDRDSNATNSPRRGDRDRDRGGGGGGGRRRKGQRNGNGGGQFGSRLGQPPSSSGGGGTLASRIQ